MRSDTAFFSAADISRRFLAGLASDLLSAAAAPFVGEEERRDVERAVGADAPRICSTSVNALISAWRRSISLWRLAIACAISLMALESSDPAMGMSNTRGWTARPPRPPHRARSRARWGNTPPGGRRCSGAADLAAVVHLALARAQLDHVAPGPACKFSGVPHHRQSPQESADEPFLAASSHSEVLGGNLVCCT